MVVAFDVPGVSRVGREERLNSRVSACKTGLGTWRCRLLQHSAKRHWGDWHQLRRRWRAGLGRQRFAIVGDWNRRGGILV